MSVAAMTWAWKQQLDPTLKFVLVALSDHANDEDYTCWPSLTHLQKKTGYSRPTVWKAIDDLIEMGAVKRVGSSDAGSTKYKVMVGNELTLGNEINQVTDLPEVGNDVNGVGNQGNKVGNHVNPNHNKHHESSRTIKRPKREESEEDKQTAKYIFHLLQVLNPDHKQPNLNSWAKEIRLMRESDKRTDNEIRELFRWANSHHFWKTNILSPAKLRQKWDTLKIQRNSGSQQHGSKEKPSFKGAI